MILILSTIQDRSTYDVINWLEYKNTDYVLFNEMNKIKHIEIYVNTNQNNIKIRTEKGHDIDFGKLTAFWHRKGKFAFEKNVTDFNSNFTSDIKQEWDRINEYLFFFCYEYLHSSKPYYQEPNKLRILRKAKEIGLSTPQTIICSQKQIVKKNNKNEGIISKNIDNIHQKNIGEYHYTNRTFKVDIRKLDNTFFPSLFQNLIEKKYEIRVFYLNKKCYAMAIFSQMNKKTEIDFRDYSVGIRYVPYQLPKTLEKKIILLMESLEYKTGSIDFIVTKKNKFIFLEINPHGQFGFLSNSCNYMVEKEIANLLIERESL